MTAPTEPSPDTALPTFGDDRFEELLDAVLRARVPGTKGLVSVERLSGGASQETYRITVTSDNSSSTDTGSSTETTGGERLLAMRRAPGGEKGDHPTAPGLAVEAELMRVARANGVPEPEVFHVLEPGDGLGEGFVMEWLDGEALGARIVRAPELDAVRPRLAFECGQVLARIHAIDIDATGLRDRLAPVPTGEFIELMWERYREYATPQPMIDFAARWLVEHSTDDVEHTLVHNDFRNGNIMVGPDGVVAVLDWEVAHVGDPMRDLGWICTNSWRFGRRDLPVGGFGAYQDLFAGYESISGVAIDPERVRFWEVFGSFWWAVGCLGMAEHFRTGPDKTVERPAIGRRSSECQVDCVNLIIPGPVSLVEPAEVDDGGAMPRIDELLVSVRDFLHGDVMAATSGRTNFMARVAGNSLDIIRRDAVLGPELRRREHVRLVELLSAGGAVTPVELPLVDLKWQLVERLRDGSMPLDQPGLHEYLRESVVNQVGIDQPRYSGYVHAATQAST